MKNEDDGFVLIIVIVFEDIMEIFIKKIKDFFSLVGCVMYVDI